MKKHDANDRVPIYIVVTTALIMVFAVRMDEEALIPAAATMVMVVVIAVICAAINKEKAAAKQKENEFPEPEAHCVVCENTGEDHFEHDRQGRIRQLDEWLKNGLIDREEYRELKKRYQGTER